MKPPSSKPGAGAAAAGASAGKAGMSPQFGPQQSTMTCPSPSSEAPHWSILSPAQTAGNSSQPSGADEAQKNTTKPCDVKTLKVDISAPKKSQSVSVSSQRRKETVAPSVPGAYRYKLQHKDLIVEILAPVKERDTTYHWGAGTKTKAAEGHEPTKLTAKATPAAVCGPEHPHLSVRGGEFNNQTTGGQAYNGHVFTPAPSASRASDLGLIWPFGDDRSQEIVVAADSCGIKPGGEATKDLSVLLVAMPDVSWKITLGLGTYSSGSASVEQKRKTGPNEDEIGHVVAFKRQRGNTSEESKRTYVAGTKFSEQQVYSDTSGVILRDTETFTNTPLNETVTDQEREEKTTVRKIKVERTVGGQTVEADVSKVLNGFLDILKNIKEISKIFDGIPKVGWSVSASFSFLTGQAVFEWGYRWPRSYAEEDRVYYVERFITIGGKVELASGKVEVFFGVEIDPWWAPVYFVAKLYVEVTVSVSISPSATWAVTNWEERDLDFNPIKIKTTAEAKLDLGATAGGEVAGYELRATLKLEGDLVFDIDAKINREGPDAEAKLETKGAHIKGEIIVVGRRRKKYDFDPIEVIKPRVIFPKSV